MHIIRPAKVTNSVLAASNVVETDYAAWAVGTTYGLGDTVIYVSPSSTFTVTVVSPAVVTWTNHGLSNGTAVTFTTTGALPTGLSTGTVYYVRDKTASTFRLALKVGGTAIATSGTQSGTHTATAQIHKVFESLQAANTGNYPLISSTWWVEVGSTNRWRMFDEALSSQTANPDSISVTLDTTGRVDSVAIFNISAATARFTMSDQTGGQTFTVTLGTPGIFTSVAHGFVNGDDVTLTTTGALPTGLAQHTVYYVANKTDDTFELSLTVGGASINTSVNQSGIHTVAEVVYDSTYTMVSDSGITDWYAYFFEPIVRITDYVELDMPPLANANINVTLSGIGETVLCGACVVGQKLNMGFTQYGANVGIQDYSIKQQDSFGNYSMLERSYAKRANMQVFVENQLVDNLQNILASYRTTSLVWVGSVEFGALQIYGPYKGFSVDIAYPTISVCNIEIEGLI